MYVCVISENCEVVLHQNIDTNPDIFMSIIQPFREGLVVGVECMLTWYSIADFCKKVGIDFVMGPALLRSLPGIGETLGLVILYEIGDIKRFSRVHDFTSYCRLAKNVRKSNGNVYGTSGANFDLGWPYRCWKIF